jgi:flagellar basal-body rod protein FlgB
MSDSLFISDSLWGHPLLNTPQLQSVSRFLDVLAFRNQLITSNVANIDTPGYRTLDINFRQELQRAENENSRGEEGLGRASVSPVIQHVRGLMERPDGNNVSLDRESLLLADVQLRYNMAVQLLRAEFHRLSSAIHEGNAPS